MKRSSRRSRANRKPQKGSALLVSLMIMVGLSMLGLGFVAISETESAISVNETYGIQAQAAAEAGAKLAMEWFQDPTWSRGNVVAAGSRTRNGNPIMPENTNAVKTQRALAAGYSGYYKNSAGTILFDKPYKPQHEDRFYGIEDNADVIVDTTTAPAIIDNINIFLFGDAAASPRITSIRVYAPPISGGSLYTQPVTNRKFWEGGTRYGVATIAATASRFVNGQATTAKVVRIIVGEFPVPIPGGPLQSATGSIDYGGSSSIHWGMEQSSEDLIDTKNGSTLPWANPYEMVHIERGYDDRVWPIQTGSTYDGFNYLHEVVGRSYTDPWFGLRAVGDVGNTVERYDRTDREDVGDPRYANFEGQDVSTYPDKKKIIFPKIDYTFWKKVAIQGRGTKGIYYFKYNLAANNGKFQRNGTGPSEHIAYWVNAVADANLGGGFYFFDTRDGSNPQGDPTPALTPDLDWSSGDVGNPFLMRGFIYMNSEDFRHTGMGSSAPNAKYKMPGEPFRDIGYRKVDADGNWAVDPVSLAMIHEGAADNEFSYQDLNGNGRFDVVVRGPLTVTYNDGAGDLPRNNQYLPKVWHADGEPDAAGDCVMPPADYDGTPSATNYCSEPHEPYFNMIYPTVRTGAVTVGWEAGNAQTQIHKASTITCTTGTTITPAQIPNDCTSNAHDEYGAAVTIPASIDGLVYNEGTYDTQGNMDVYGALLCGGEITGNGNLDFWFKEELKRGDYLPPGAPRVIIYSMQTDDVD